MEAEEIEVTVIESNPEEPIKEELRVEAPPPEPDIPHAVAFAPDLAPPPIPLAPESQAPLAPGEDAPSKAPPSPKTDPVTPLTNSTGDTPALGKANGPITSPNGTGSGFGKAAQPTGYAPGGKPGGVPDGKPGGIPNGKPGGVPGQTAVRRADLATYRGSAARPGACPGTCGSSARRSCSTSLVLMWEANPS